MSNGSVCVLRKDTPPVHKDRHGYINQMWLGVCVAGIRRPIPNVDDATYYNIKL